MELRLRMLLWAAVEEVTEAAGEAHVAPGRGQSLALHRMCGAPSEIVMSRTDVHRPWRVQVADPYNRHLFYRYPAWPWQTELTSFKNLGCGCRLCTQYDWRKQERRRSRHSWRRDPLNYQ